MTYKEAIEELLTAGRYLRRMPGTAKKQYRYRLYKGRQTLIAKVPPYFYWRLREVLTDNDGKLTLSRRAIQRQHGSTVVKRLYRQRVAQEKEDAAEKKHLKETHGGDRVLPTSTHWTND